MDKLTAGGCRHGGDDGLDKPHKVRTCPSVEDVIKEHDIRAKVEGRLSVHRGTYRLLIKDMLGDRPPASLNRHGVSLLLDIDQSLTLMEAGVDMMRRVADESANGELQRAISPGSIDETLHVAYTSRRIAGKCGTIEQLLGIAPVVCLLMYVVRSFYTPPGWTPASDALRMTAHALSSYDASGAFDFRTPAHELSGALGATDKTRTQVLWDVIFRDIISAMAPAARERLTLLGDAYESIEWSPTVFAYLVDVSRRSREIPYTRQDVDGISRWLNNLARLQDRNNALIEAAAEKSSVETCARRT
jgi:hypothetical protein